MTKKWFLVLVSGVVLAGCTTGPKKEEIMVTPTEQLVGNDKDEYGCIGSAGYSWCGAKQKCLRVWEEKCEVEVTTEEAIGKFLAEKYQKDIGQITIKINKEAGNYASGTVRFGTGDEPGNAGGFLATKISGNWAVVWDGNGVADCKKLRTEYKFPDEILKPNYCD